MVLNGIAPMTLLVPYYQKLMQDFSTRLNMAILVCNNSLKSLDIDPSSLPTFAKVVPAGILSIAQYEASGYAYVKP